MQNFICTDINAWKMWRYIPMKVSTTYQVASMEHSMRTQEVNGSPLNLPDDWLLQIFSSSQLNLQYSRPVYCLTPFLTYGNPPLPLILIFTTFGAKVH